MRAPGGHCTTRLEHHDCREGWEAAAGAQSAANRGCHGRKRSGPLELSPTWAFLVPRTLEEGEAGPWEPSEGPAGCAGKLPPRPFRRKTLPCHFKVWKYWLQMQWLGFLYRSLVGHGHPTCQSATMTCWGWCLGVVRQIGPDISQTRVRGRGRRACWQAPLHLQPPGGRRRAGPDARQASVRKGSASRRPFFTLWSHWAI